MLRAQLIDDGTLDTVLRCTNCDSAGSDQHYAQPDEGDREEWLKALIEDFKCEFCYVECYSCGEEIQPTGSVWVDIGGLKLVHQACIPCGRCGEPMKDEEQAEVSRGEHVYVIHQSCFEEGDEIA